MRRNLDDRQIGWRVIDGVLERHVTLSSGKSYKHRCSTATFERVAAFIDDHVDQRHRLEVAPKSRRHYSPSDRLEILQIMRLRDWSVVQTSREFVLHTNTLHAWIRELHGPSSTGRIFITPVWNRIDDAIRWAARQLRSLCPEPECGTRTIARLLVRAGIQISRATVQRVLREAAPKQTSSRAAMTPPAGETADRLLVPKAPNHVWHMDFTTLQLPWVSLVITAVMDGFSRKILRLKVYPKPPTSHSVARLVATTARRCGLPKHLVTDHGYQFKHAFHETMQRLGIHHVRGRVRCPAVNGKIERFFRTFRLWVRCAIFSLNPRALQRRLDAYTHWYNQHRPHASHGASTPEERWSGYVLPMPIPYYAADRRSHSVRVERVACRGDPRLPIFKIRIEERRAAA